MKTLKSTRGNTLVVVLTMIVLMSLIASALFALFAGSFPSRVEAVRRQEQRMVMETIAFDLLNSDTLEEENVDEPMAIPEIEAFNFTWIETGGLWVLTIIPLEARTDRRLEITVTYNFETRQYELLRKGVVNHGNS